MNAQTSGCVKGVIYARYSSSGQRDESIEGQLRDCHTFAERYGSFWQQVIAQLPPYDERSKPSFVDGAVCSLCFAPGSDPTIEHALEDILQSLFPLAAFFAGEMDAADRRDDRFLEYFIFHWRRIRGVYLSFSNDEVERLVTKFPQLKNRWDEKALANMSLSDLLCGLYYEEPAQAIAIWRSLAGTSAPLKDGKAAETFMFQMKLVWYAGEARPELLRPLLEALRDEDFARQIFQSAFVNGFHLELINAAYACGEETLAEHFLALLSKNPLPWKRWAESGEELKTMLAAWLKEEKARMKQPPRTQGGGSSAEDDGTVFHYCAVHVSGVRRPYAYLTGGLSLQVGDWVEVPFGKDDLPRHGQVGSLTVCTRASAPWPPEQTKTVLRVVDVPVAPEKMPAQATHPASISKPKPTPEPAQKKPLSKAAPEPVPTPEPIPVTVQKHRFPWKLVCGGIVIFVCIACISAFAYRCWR